jgi:hypothetical protein
VLALDELAVGINGCSLKTGRRCQLLFSVSRRGLESRRTSHGNAIPTTSPSVIEGILLTLTLLYVEDNLRVAASVPASRLLLETDCPWCDIRPSHAGARLLRSPRPEARDKKKHDEGAMVKGRNEPCSILQVFEVVSGAREEADVEALAAQVHRNTMAMFFPQEKKGPVR